MASNDAGSLRSSSDGSSGRVAVRRLAALDEGSAAISDILSRPSDERCAAYYGCPLATSRQGHALLENSHRLLRAFKHRRPSEDRPKLRVPPPRSDVLGAEASTRIRPRLSAVAQIDAVQYPV